MSIPDYFQEINRFGSPNGHLKQIVNCEFTIHHSQFTIHHSQLTINSEFILYAPSEQLQQVETQIRAEFKHIITSFEWFYEDEFTSIIVEIGKMAGHIDVEERCFQIINSIISDGYIVDLLVRPVESIEQPDGLFNLAYEGAGNTFFVDYYAPERPPSNPLRVSIYYTRMIKGLRTIHFDSPSELWERLFRPVQEELAKRRGVHSFSQQLAPDLRDFLLEHLDFIQRMVQASGEQLEILPPPQSIPLHQPSNGTEPNRMPRQKHVWREERKGARQKQARLQPALAA